MGDFYAEWERPEFDSVPTLAENAVYLLPGCDDVLLRKTLQQFYRDFCRRSAALRTWRCVELEQGVCAYPIAPLLSGEVDCVTQVRWANYSRAPVRGWRVTGDAPPMLELPRGLGMHSIDASSPSIVWVQEKENVAATPVEASSMFSESAALAVLPAVMVEAVEVPHIGEERAPKAFLQRHGDAIIDGALARLFSMSGRAWTDAEQARQRAVAYENAVADARLRGMQGGPAANPGGRFGLDLGGMV